jgi:uncharacterized protein (DUF433 family)
MASVVEIGSLIDRDSKIRGRPKITGTGLTVSRIAGWYKLGMSPEEIALEYPHLTLAQIHAALAYYHVNRDEIETDIAAEQAAAIHIIVAPQQRYSVGEEIRRVMRLIRQRTADEMLCRLEFMSGWS